MLNGRNLFTFYRNWVGTLYEYNRSETKFDKVILTHTVRKINELAYFDTLNKLNEDEVYSQVTQGKFYYFNTVTREKWEELENYRMDKNNNLWSYLKIEDFNPKHDR